MNGRLSSTGKLSYRRLYISIYGNIDIFLPCNLAGSVLEWCSSTSHASIFHVPDSAESRLLLRVWLLPYTRNLIRGRPCCMASPTRSAASVPDAVGAARLSPPGLGWARMQHPELSRVLRAGARERTCGPPTHSDAESDAVPPARAGRTAPHGVPAPPSSGLPMVDAAMGPRAL